PDSEETLLHLTDVLLGARLPDRARELLKSFVGTRPHHRDVLIKLAELDREAEDWKAATASLSHLIALEQGEGLVPLALELYQVADRAGSPGEARDALERALGVAPGHPELTRLLRQMYEAVGAYRE